MQKETTYDISVVIVNYNVAYFLEQCLNSVFKALTKCSGEVFVVDNDSIDASIEMIKDKFPQVTLIENKENVGFSKANNQAIASSKGEFILLLNPDTVVEEDTFLKVIMFMKAHPEAGGLGVRMLDGKGKFLPESKRGLPTPLVALTKIIGLSSLFPKSKYFGKYHLGYLDEHKTNEVDILSGAFMLMRKKTLEKVGLLDEAFFMYGEDVDLSYRIQLGGYKNYYFPETRIIHYKGESTKKSSVNYVFVFYNAMIIFAQKHFSNKNAAVFSFLINMAIYLRAGIAILSRFIKKIALPMLDFVSILSLLYLSSFYWEKHLVKFPEHILKIALPLYTILWITGIYMNGAYDKPHRLKKIPTGILIGTVIILVIYALVPKSVQFSRLFILIGAGLAISQCLCSRLALHLFIGNQYSLKEVSQKKFVIVGSLEESIRVEQILKASNVSIGELIFVSATEKKDTLQKGTIHQLDQITFIHNINEVIFCAKDVSAQIIISWMVSLEDNLLEFKIAQPDALFLIGSNSIHNAKESYAIELHEISKQESKRKKRNLDLITALAMIPLSPFSCFLFRNKKQFFLNLIQLLFGKKTLIGYYFNRNEANKRLPPLKKGILNPTDPSKDIDNEIREKLNLLYARDYNIWKDIEILKKSWKYLDRT